MSRQGRAALRSVEGATAGEVFRVYGEQGLGPTLPPGDLVSRDNLGAHKASGIREAIPARGAQLRYLPPDSPELSPSGPCWAEVKTAPRGIGARTRRALGRALQQVPWTIPESDALAWFAHCGAVVN